MINHGGMLEVFYFDSSCSVFARDIGNLEDQALDLI